MGLITVRETPEQAQALAVPGAIQADMLEASAILPRSGPRGIDDPRRRAPAHPPGRRSTLRPRGPRRRRADASTGDVVEIATRATSTPGPRAADLARYLAPEPFIESDAPEIRAEAEKAVAGAAEPRLRAERLVRYVQRAAREEADHQPALRARGAADAGRRLQRAHRALRGAWPAPRASRRGSPSAWSSCAAPSTTTRGPRSSSTKASGGRGRLAPRRSDAQPVPRRRHARAPGPRRPRPAGRDPAADRPREDRRARRRARARRHARARRPAAATTCGR